MDLVRDEKLKNILYISIPEGMNVSLPSFSLDPEKMLPIETAGEQDSWSIDELSWEMILSGMLKVLAYHPEHEDADYYRQFIVSARPDIIAELTQTAILKADNKDFDIAEEIFLALLGLQPESNRAQLNLALLYEKRAEAYRMLGKEALTQEFEDEAYHWYRVCTDHSEPLPETYLYSGYFFMKIRNYGRSRASFHAYLDSSENPDHKNEVEEILAEFEKQNLNDILFKEAYDFIRLNKETEGLEKIEQFLSANPGVWNAWFIKGWALRRLSRYEEALQAFEKTLELGGQNPDTLNEHAICCMETGNLGQAQESLLGAMELEPENTKILSNLGVLHMKAEEYEEARGFFETVLVIDPDDPLAPEYITEIDKRLNES
ncbi:hypothetical protein DC28_02640 [Spirochaeta lutea]|uniref:Uncharacterized protein n=1 Tax=Spirochaeta lutea TaxID=1480694 RepID=A0A098R1L8_9SPIO|nr:hypothetical protein DC28_02640 [Spirochaeta lutea]